MIQKTFLSKNFATVVLLRNEDFERKVFCQNISKHRFLREKFFEKIDF